MQGRGRGGERDRPLSLSLSLSLVKCHRSVCIKFRWVQTIGVRSDFNQLGRVCTTRFLWTGDRETRWNAIPRYDVDGLRKPAELYHLYQWWTMTAEGAGKAVLVNGRMEGKAISVSNRYLDIGIIIDLLIFKNDIYEASKGFISEMKKWWKEEV